MKHEYTFPVYRLTLSTGTQLLVAHSTIWQLRKWVVDRFNERVVKIERVRNLRGTKVGKVGV